MSGQSNGPLPPMIGAEPVTPRDPARLAHLAENRSLIVRRSLMSSAVGGLVPLPVMDDIVAGRIRAGLFMRLAATRHVDLPQPSADLLADPREGSALKNVTLTAAALIAIKLAWRKVFVLLAAGRGAEEMATTFQFATLVDHYCARLHVGGAITRPDAAQLHKLILTCIERSEKTALVNVFRDGGKVLGRSLLEAPRWIGERMAAAVQRFGASGGNPDVILDETERTGPEGAVNARWLDRATRLVEERLSGLGQDYLGALVDRFETDWRNRPVGAAPPASPGD